MKLVLISVGVFFISMLAAHFLAPPGYDPLINTISDLAHQGHPYMWVMKTGFIAFGAILILGIIFLIQARGKTNLIDILLFVYACCVALSGIFSTAPINPSLPFNPTEAWLHSLFATLAGIAFILTLLIAVKITRPVNVRNIHLIFLILVVGTSALFGLSDAGLLTIGKGLIQRLFYTFSLTWLAAVYGFMMLPVKK